MARSSPASPGTPHETAAVHASVAVVIPAFNAERTLAAAIRSSLRAGAGQVLVVDDGSTDGTLDLARTFGGRVRALSGPNRGVSAARNRGIRETCGDWLLFLDADDELVGDTISARLQCARTGEADVVITDWEELVEDGRGGVRVGERRALDWASLEADAELGVATSGWATTAAILYRRSLVERIGGFREELPIVQDARFLFDAIHSGGRIVHLPGVGARYRVAADSLSRRDSGKFWCDVLENGRQIQGVWEKRSTLTPARRQGLVGIYNHAARGLFAAGHPRYFEAIRSQIALGCPLPRHSRIAPMLAQVLGLHAARTLLGILGR